MNIRLALLATLLLNLTVIKASEVSPTEFFKTRLGNYKIELSGGSEPHGNSIGTIEDLTDEALITLGYCDDSLGFCDVGYRSMPYKSTWVTQTHESGDCRVFSLVANVSGQESKYEWEENTSTIWFRTFNYKLPNGEVIPVLEHKITKIDVSP